MGNQKNGSHFLLVHILFPGYGKQDPYSEKQNIIDTDGIIPDGLIEDSHAEIEQGKEKTGQSRDEKRDIIPEIYVLVITLDGFFDSFFHGLK